MNMFKKAITHFFEFHQGVVNVVGHIIGFLGIFYSIYTLDWILFAVFLVVLEFGHVYNHVAGIKKYDFRPHVAFWRVVLFVFAVVFFYGITLIIK